MTARATDLSVPLIDRVEKWLEQCALDGLRIDAIVAGTCERLAAAGVPLTRVHLSFSMLHPLYDALGFIWVRGEGLTIHKLNIREDVGPEKFLKSPYYYLLSNDLEHLRRRIDPASPSEFPIFDDLKAIGITDYLGFVQSFGDYAGRGMLGSWATDAVGGFPDQVIEALLRLQRRLAVTAKMSLLSKLAGNMLSSYLGENAGMRVLSGQIRRGDAETIRAVVVMADMRNSTAFAERAGRESYVETLNQFFDAIAEPFNHSGGEILSFVGDGFLAVYPCERHAGPSRIAAAVAQAAAFQARTQMAELNARRQADGLEPIGFGIALHLGNVMFGNVGLKKRLTFSAYGSAVNEAQRLERLTKVYGAPILASNAFVDYCDGDWTLIGEEKLDGVAKKMPIYAPATVTDEVAATVAARVESDAEAHSEAEQVMLLFRNQSKAGASSGGLLPH